MIEILRKTDLTSITHYPKSVVDTIRQSVSNLDEAYGADRTRDGDGGLELIVETEDELRALIQSLPYGDLPESAEELAPDFIHAVYVVGNERTLDIFTPKKWATKSMLEELAKC